MAVRGTVDDGHCDCIEKHDVTSEHRDESKFTEKVITNIETGQNSAKWSRRSRWVNKTLTKNRNQDMRAERIDESKNGAKNTLI